MFSCLIEELKSFRLDLSYMKSMKTCLLLLLTLHSISIDNDTEVLNVQECTGDVYNQIPDNLGEAKADGRNIWTGELFSFSTSL